MKSPAFQFYPQDFISSLDVQVMNVEQVGAYMLLLINAWTQDPQGYLPNNDRLLQMICRMNDKQWAKNKALVLKKFSVDGEFIYNPRMMKELEKQAEFRKKQAENGKKGGRPPKEEPNANPKKPTAFSGETQTKPNESSSFSSSSSTSFSPSNEEDKSSSSGSGEPKESKFLALFNNTTGRRFQKLDTKAEKQFKKLDKQGYTEDQFKLAIKNGYENSTRWDSPNLFTPEYISRETNFIKYLNWESGGNPPPPTQRNLSMAGMI